MSKSMEERAREHLLAKDMEWLLGSHIGLAGKALLGVMAAFAQLIREETLEQLAADPYFVGTLIGIGQSEQQFEDKCRHMARAIREKKER